MVELAKPSQWFGAVQLAKPSQWFGAVSACETFAMVWSSFNHSEGL
jgi:hypothetical protein